MLILSKQTTAESGMTFLQLAQAVKRESGAQAGSGPTSVSTTILAEQRIFHWVNWANRDLTLTREDWRWRRGSATMPSTTSGTLTPANFSIPSFASWKREAKHYRPSCKVLPDGAEAELRWMEYDQFRQTFVVGAPAAGTPQYWSVSPNDEFLLGPTPESAVFVRADYIKGYSALTADSDIPDMPSRFHMAIVWKALMEYGGFDAAGETYQRALTNFQAIWTQMVQSQLEAPTFAHRSLA